MMMTDTIDTIEKHIEICERYISQRDEELKPLKNEWGNMNAELNLFCNERLTAQSMLEKNYLSGRIIQIENEMMKISKEIDSINESRSSMKSILMYYKKQRWIKTRKQDSNAEIDPGIWIEHTGYECPVDPDTLVTIKFDGFMDGVFIPYEPASEIYWGFCNDVTITHYMVKPSEQQGNVEN